MNVNCSGIDFLKWQFRGWKFTILSLGQVPNLFLFIFTYLCIFCQHLKIGIFHQEVRFLAFTEKLGDLAILGPYLQAKPPAKLSSDSWPHCARTGNGKTSSVKAEQGMGLESQIGVLIEEHSLSKEVAKEAASVTKWLGRSSSVKRMRRAHGSILESQMALTEQAGQF